MFFRKMKRRPGAPTHDELAALDEEIAKYESVLESAPLKLMEQRERERTTIPAPDDFEDRRRERRFYADLSRGQIINERRFRTRNTVIFVLLLAATVSLCWWIYQELLRNGVLS
ncbi:MAG: hypothetical protein PVJ98_09695 [Akkermansiaceae bacterium]|jgi:hypothetical protein